MITSLPFTFLQSYFFGMYFQEHRTSRNINTPPPPQKKKKKKIAFRVPVFLKVLHAYFFGLKSLAHMTLTIPVANQAVLKRGYGGGGCKTNGFFLALNLFFSCFNKWAGV